MDWPTSPRGGASARDGVGTELLTGTSATSTARTRSRAGLASAGVVLVAALFGVLHLLPTLHAAATTPSGWHFTGNVTVSPDFMQYMAWARRSQIVGPIVDNPFTPEPNPPHLLVLFYYLVGQISRVTGISPEFVYAYLGAPLAFTLAILVFWTVRQFFSEPTHVWWVSGIVLLGGGLGSHLKILEGVTAVRESPLLHRLIIEPLWNQSVLENRRGDYIFLAMFDTHFLAIWIVTLGAVLSLYIALRRNSKTMVMGTAALFGFATLFHVYEGVTLAAILVGVAACCYRSPYRRAALILCGSCAAAIVMCAVGSALLYSRSGLPVSPWRGPDVPFAILLIAFPIAWLALATSTSSFWQELDLDRRFLLGWLLGCTAVTLSSPFYPYPARGTVTLQVPLYILAGLAYFARRPRITPLIMGLIVVLAAVTPVWAIQHAWKHSAFTTGEPHKFMNADHERVRDTLVGLASPNDVLVADEYELLWLAREYPGRHYCGHFFLTTRYTERRREVARFFSASPEAQSEFLRDNHIRFVYVSADQSPQRFDAVPGLRRVLATAVGSLFEYR